MNGIVAGALVTVLAGSVSLSNAEGASEVAQGRSAALVPAAAPLEVASPQDPEALLRRLEQLVAAIARLEDEISKLEARNKQLKAQVESPGPRNPVFFGGNGGGAGGFQLELKEADPNKGKK